MPLSAIPRGQVMYQTCCEGIPRLGGQHVIGQPDGVGLWGSEVEVTEEI